MQREKNIRMQGVQLLRSMFSRGKGTKKHLDKMKNKGKPAQDKIYVDSTCKTYEQGWHVFCDYLDKQNVHTRKLPELVPYVQPFIDWLVSEDYAPHSVHTWASAVSKVLGLHLDDYHLPKRERAGITRSRYPVKSDAHFAPAKHQDLVDFCRSVGPRNRKELAYIRGKHLVALDDGRYAVDIQKGKGGKQRFAPIYGPPARVESVVALMQAAGDQLLFERIPSAADIHAYRAEYACTIYQTHARPVEELPREEKYICRKDMAGTVFDKAAMRIASEALGHNRLDIIASSYLWALDSFF